MYRRVCAVALTALASVASAQSVTVTLSEWNVRMKPDTVRAGRVTFQITNDGSMTHQFHITGPDTDKETQPIARRQAAPLTVTLRPGTYEVYCPMSEGSHKMAGMKTILTVTGSPGPPPPKQP